MNRSETRKGLFMWRRARCPVGLQCSGQVSSPRKKDRIGIIGRATQGSRLSVGANRRSGCPHNHAMPGRNLSVSEEGRREEGGGEDSGLMRIWQEPEIGGWVASVFWKGRIGLLRRILVSSGIADRQRGLRAESWCLNCTHYKTPWPKNGGVSWGGLEEEEQHQTEDRLVKGKGRLRASSKRKRLSKCSSEKTQIARRWG